MQAPFSRFAEEISILLLALWGMAGEPFVGAALSAAGGGPAAVCCVGSGEHKIAPRSRGLVVRVVGIPFGFELSAAVGIDRPFILTLYSEPDFSIPRAWARLE